MMKTLIISGHPDLSTSVANQTILKSLKKALPDAEIRKLDQLYPDAVIDVEAEQKALLEVDSPSGSSHSGGIPCLGS